MPSRDEYRCTIETAPTELLSGLSFSGTESEREEPADAPLAPQRMQPEQTASTPSVMRPAAGAAGTQPDAGGVEPDAAVLQDVRPGVGTVLDGRYRLVRKIGSGGTAEVFLAEHVALGNAWAVKMLAVSDGTLDEHLKEAGILKRLNHPMLPRIADIIRTGSHICIVMDYLRGQNLLERLDAGGRIRESEVRAWMIQLCELLAYLHGQKPEPVIYRDLKPSNLLADEQGHLKLVDFGTARTYRDGGDGDTAYIGTQGYAAPEQYGINQSDGRTDLYNLGMTMFHLLTGTHPITIPHGDLGDCMRDAGVSPELVAVIRTCVQLSPANRYQRAEACRDALMAPGTMGMADMAGPGSVAVARARLTGDQELRGQETVPDASAAGRQTGRNGLSKRSRPRPTRLHDESDHMDAEAGPGGFTLHGISDGKGGPPAGKDDKKAGFFGRHSAQNTREGGHRVVAQIRIGVMGVCRGAGATFAAITLACHLTSRGYRTSLVELNASGDFKALQAHLEAGGLPVTVPHGPSTEGAFRFNGVDYHPGCSRLTDMRGSRSEVVVMDLGACRGGQALEELRRADWQFAYCPIADWRFAGIPDFLESMDQEGCGEGFTYLVPRDGAINNRFLTQLFGVRRVIGFPFVRNPFSPDRTEVRELDRTLRMAGLDL